MFSTKFIAATREFTSLESGVPAPYFRRSFTVTDTADTAAITICGLGFYELFLNGERLTKGYLAPYISNPDDILYYDTYDVAARLKPGKNTIGVLLGNGFLNNPGGTVWDFHTARFRSAPKLALSFAAALTGGETIAFEADESFVTAPSPIYYDDYRVGEFYDARAEIPGWNLPDFDDSAWAHAIPAETPRGTCRLCEADPIVITEERAALSVARASIGALSPLHNKVRDIVISADGVEAETRGWLYDFGVNAAGLCRLKICGEPGQKIVLQFGEHLYENGDLDLRGMNFLPLARDHRDIYICRGGEEEIWTPCFTYHGFRYCLVLGMTEKQATPDALTYLVMNSDLRTAGDFSCSDETLNRLQAATRVADLANFYYFPTDCPHREKNGWTADAALSTEQMLLNFTPEKSYREWLHNIRAAQREDGALPGIIPTSGWGFAWGNGPAWDSIAAYLPYFVWLYRGDTEIIRENAHMLMRYIHYITTQRDERGLIHIGLGDWVHYGTDGNPSSPLEFTDTVLCMDICRKAAVCFGAVGMTAQKNFAETVYAEFRAAARRYLIDYGTMTALGNCQASQAMAIFYDVFDPAEKPEAARVLVRMVESCDGLMDVGVLGGRVLFRVLSEYGHTDLAVRMIVDTRCPSYGSWIADGATALYESFRRPGGAPSSLNHHFWGDISGFMISCIAGIVVNPYETTPNEVRIQPHFVEALTHAEAYHDVPAGRVSSAWRRDGEEIELTVEAPAGCRGEIRLESGWVFASGKTFPYGNAVTPLRSGTFRIVRR